MKTTLALLFLSFFSLITSCDTVSSKKNLETSLVIVSDYLTSKDTVLFTAFAKKEKVRIFIRTKTTDQIIGAFRKSEYGTKYDIIMMSSLFDVHRLSKINCLHPITELEDELIETKKFSSSKYNFIGFGIDPFVLRHHKDTISRSKTYSDLKQEDFNTNLTQEELVPMLSALMSRLNKVQSYNWVKQFHERKAFIAKPNQKSPNRPVFLTTYSKGIDTKNKDLFKHYKDIFIPNQRTKGSFYDLKTFAIVKQAEHFTTAKSFIKHYLKEKQNLFLTQKLNVYSVCKNKRTIRLYKVSSDNLIQYYSMIQRIQSKL